MDNREHFQEINALVASIAKALGLEEKAAATALEGGAIVLSMGEDDNGNRYIEARHGEAVGRIYQGAIQYAPGAEPPTPEDGTSKGDATKGGTPAPDAAGCSSGGGCGCSGG